jgi:hypothetical protein
LGIRQNAGVFFGRHDEVMMQFWQGGEVYIITSLPACSFSLAWETDAKWSIAD